MSSTTKNTYIGSILLDFPVLPKYCTETAWEEVQDKISKILESRFGPLNKLFSGLVHSQQPNLGGISLLSGEKGVTINIRSYPSRSHITTTVEYDANDEVKPLLSFDEISTLERQLAQEFKSFKKTAPIPQIKRGLDFDIYFTTSDSRLMEYDIEKMLFDAQSEYQHVQIARSINYGNILILDGLVNLAEADVNYTEAIMHRGVVDYTGKDVLILGGGDGALLYELRKENAKSITMIEIDDVVMKACKLYLRGASGDTLDNYKAENYEIVLGDCIPFMIKCKEEGKFYDFVFGDLTDIPISTSPQAEIWDFFRTTLQLSFAILRENGTYFTHANGITAGENLKMFSQTIKDSLGFPVDLKQTSTFVPSFQEKWIFYEVKRV